MKRISISLLMIALGQFTFAQQSVLISPNGTEAIKFNNTVTEKITLFETNSNQKSGIGLSNSKFNFYVPLSTDNFTFGVGALSSFNEKFRITGAGNIGVGGKIPSSYGHGGTNRILEIYNSDIFPDAQSQLILTTASLEGGMGGITWASPAVTSPDKRVGYLGTIFNSGSVGSSTNTSMLFFTSNAGNLSERMRLDNSGYLGIGTQTPVAPINIYHSLPRMFFQNSLSGTSATDGLAIGSNSNSSYVWNYENFPLRFATNNIERVTLSSNGNLGINNQSPNAPLHFSNSIEERKIVLFEDANNNHQFNGFGIVAGQLKYQVGSTSADHVFNAGSSATISKELLRIKGNGLVGIGTSTPSTQLTLKEDLLGGQVSFQSTASGGQVTDGFLVGMGAGMQALLYNNEDTDMLFATNNSYRMKITNTGNLELLGTGKIVNEAYTTLILLNGWIHNGGFAIPSYYKDKEGRVHLKGGIASGTTTINTVIATLPVGYRPINTETLVFPIYSLGGSNASIAIEGSTGQIRVYTGTIGSTLNTFDGISFRAE
jgi:hypothetical protein